MSDPPRQTPQPPNTPPDPAPAATSPTVWTPPAETPAVQAALAEAPIVAEASTVADDEIVIHIGAQVHRYIGLEPDREYVFEGLALRTLPKLGSELLATVATVNDVHFGETECGVIENSDIGPVMRSAPGEPPYPDLMNGAAIAEMVALSGGRGPDAVVVKGDLTARGTRAEYEQFLRFYQGAFPSRLCHVRGNHDAYTGGTFANFSVQEVALPGVILAVIDTTLPGLASGQVTGEQLDWLDELGARADRPVLVFGHHHPWDPGNAKRSPTYFGICPDDSERLVEVFARRLALVGYFAGHTHRSRVRRFKATGDVPWAEVASVKDFPGAWVEYRVYDGGILQIQRRVSSPEALAWTERTRAMFAGLYPGYSFGTVEDRCFPILLRS